METQAIQKSGGYFVLQHSTAGNKCYLT